MVYKKEFETSEYFSIATPIKIGDTGKYWALIINVPKDKVLAGTLSLAKVQTTLSF